MKIRNKAKIFAADAINGFISPILLVSFLTSSCSNNQPGTLDSADLEAIKAADRAYVTAWLSNDSERVIKTLASNPVIIPSGLQAIKGLDSIRQFWWPRDSPPAEIIEFEISQQEVGGDGDFGFVRGTFLLDFTFDGQQYSNRGTYISLLHLEPDGVWRISHRMWNDYP